MKAALIETDGWAGHEAAVYTGEDAQEILFKFSRSQDLDCLLRMAKENEDAADALEDLLDKYNYGELVMADLQTMDIRFPAGAIRCSGIAETDEEVAALRARI